MGIGAAGAMDSPLDRWLCHAGARRAGGDGLPVVRAPLGAAARRRAGPRQPEAAGDPGGPARPRVESHPHGRGSLVPLSALARLTAGVGPLAVTHSGQLPSVTISFDLQPGTSLSQGVAAVDRAARELLPPNINTSFQGTAQAFQSSLQGLGLLLVMAILVIYLVLGILYESFIHPLTILSALPFAGFGALVTLMVFRTELSMYAFVGIILLVGLVKKNGIMMIDFAIEAQRDKKLTPAEAIYEAQQKQNQTQKKTKKNKKTKKKQKQNK